MRYNNRINVIVFVITMLVTGIASAQQGVCCHDNGVKTAMPAHSAAQCIRPGTC